MFNRLRCRRPLGVVVVVAACAAAFTGRALAQTGKCCQPDGRGCVNVTAEVCAARGGTFVAGQMCASEEDTCDGPVLGACCPSGGACVFVPNTQCGGGVGQFFPNSPCSPTICTPPATGACCENFQCRLTVAVDCQSPGATFFSGQGCSAGLCGTPPSGACCRFGECLVTLRDECFAGTSAAEWYQDQPCAPGLCRLGACCTSPLSCVIVTSSGCEQGVWTADGTCVPFFCSAQTGSCCRATGPCVVTADFDCLDGVFVASGVCTPSTCAPSLGACCSGATCFMAIPGACEGTNMRYVGNGSACNEPGNTAAPCCLADFNQSGGTSVQDIFDYLAEYFSQDPGADINGGGLSVQDLFDYLAAYFGGC